MGPFPMSAGMPAPEQPAEPAELEQQPAVPADESAVMPRLVSGDVGEAVAQAAQLLAAHGHANDVAAGARPMLSSALEAVVREFQRARELAETGVIDAATWAHLMAAPATETKEQLQ